MIAAKSIELSFWDDLSRLSHSVGKMSQGGESVGLQGLDCSWCHAKILGPLIEVCFALYQRRHGWPGSSSPCWLKNLPRANDLTSTKLRFQTSWQNSGFTAHGKQQPSYQMTCPGKHARSNEGFQFMGYWQVSAPCHSIASGQSSCSHALPVYGSVVRAGRESTCRSGRAGAHMPHSQNKRRELRQVSPPCRGTPSRTVTFLTFSLSHAPAASLADRVHQVGNLAGHFICARNSYHTAGPFLGTGDAESSTSCARPRNLQRWALAWLLASAS